jgi:hypothetical protein
MTDQNQLVMEEMRAIKAMHVDSMSKLGELCGNVRELVVELRHTQKGFDEVSVRVKTLEAQMHAIQIEGAVNKPILDIAKSMSRSVWIAIATAVLAVGMTSVGKLPGKEGAQGELHEVAK